MALAEIAASAAPVRFNRIDTLAQSICILIVS